MANLTKKFNLNLSRETVLTIFTVALVGLFVLFNSYVAQNWWLYLFFLLPAGLIIMTCPESGLFALIFGTMIFERWFTLEPIRLADSLIKLYPLDIVIIFTLLGVLWQWSRGQKFIWRDKVFSWGLWAFFLVVALNFVRALYASQVDLELAFSTFKNFALYFVVYLLVVNIIRTPEQFKRFIGVFLAAGFFLLYFVFYGLVTGQGIWAEFVPLSTWGSRILGGSQSFYITLLIILLLNLLLRRQKFSRWDYFYFVLLAVFLFALAASLQRHLWLALVIGLGISLFFYQPLQRRKIRQIFVVGAFLVVFLVLVSLWLYSWQNNNFLTNSDILQAIKYRVTPVFVPSELDSSALWRFSSWSRAWEIFKANWLWGVGLGQKLSFEILDTYVTVEMRQLHNDFIAAAVQMGLLGILAVIYLVGSVLRGFAKYYSRISREYQLYFLTFFIWAVIFLWSANFGIYFDLNTLVIFFWLALGGMTLSRKLGEGVGSSSLKGKN